MCEERNCCHRHSITFRNGDKNYAICQKNRQTSHNNKEVETAEPVQINIYQTNTYRKDFNWLHFGDDPRVQERQQMKDKQY